jgi:hypothetical protein
MHLAVWSVFLEWIGPRYQHRFFPLAVSDPRDEADFAVGTMIAGPFWGAWTGGRPARPKERTR